MPGQRFSHIHVDLVGPLLQSCGFSYLFTIIDRSLRWPDTIHLQSTTAEECAFVLLHSLIPLFWVPSVITSILVLSGHPYAKFWEKFTLQLLPPNLSLTGLWRGSTDSLKFPSMLDCWVWLVLPPSPGSTGSPEHSQRRLVNFLPQLMFLVLVGSSWRVPR